MTQKTFSLLHPSRQRPLKAFETCADWLNKISGHHAIEYILSVDADDPDLPQYIKYFETPDNSIKILVNENRSLVDAVNVAAAQCTGDIMIVVSDDMFAPQDYDSLIAKEVEGKEDWLLKVHDGTEGWLVTLSICDRKYYERFGYIYNDNYNHLFCDTEQTTVAIMLGRLIEANHIKFEHRHWTKTAQKPTDASYQRSNATWMQGEKMFIHRFNNNFDIQPAQIVGRITDQPTIEFLRKRGARI